MFQKTCEWSFSQIDCLFPSIDHQHGLLSDHVNYFHNPSKTMLAQTNKALHPKIGASLLHAHGKFMKHYLAHKHVFNVCITFGTLNSSGSSKNMSLSISFPWRKSAFTSMLSHFHPFYKNNIQASQTSSFLQICCRFFSSKCLAINLVLWSSYHQ